MALAAVIADDLTGAADTGAAFARSGYTVEVRFGPAEGAESDVLVFSTESRALGEAEARARASQAGEWARGAGLIYKKIDSTLRGQPCAELAGLLEVLGSQRVLLAPAFPAQGRTTRDGIQYAHGQPVGSGSTPNPVLTSDLSVLFRGCGLPLRRLSLDALRSGQARKIFRSPDAGLIVADAEDDTELFALAGLALEAGLSMFCGSAGLAGALARWLPVPSGAALPFARVAGGVLGVAGSRHAVTAGQVAAALRRGIAVIEFDPDGEPGHRADCAARAGQLLAGGRDVILSTCASSDSPLGPGGVAERLGRLAGEVACQGRVGGLVLTGGEVAMAVLTALEARGLVLQGELLPGIPRGSLRGGSCPGLAVITKAGGFGRKDALVRAVQSLKGDIEPE